MSLSGSYDYSLNKDITFVGLYVPPIKENTSLKISEREDLVPTSLRLWLWMISRRYDITYTRDSKCLWDQEGAFDDAVKGVDAIEHTASPFTMAIDDPQGLSYSEPRYARSTNPCPSHRIYRARSPRNRGHPSECFEIRVCFICLRISVKITNAGRPNVKRVVITGSCAAVSSPPPKPTDFSEKDWNTASLEDVEKNGRNAQQMSKYRSSKVLAEKGSVIPYPTEPNVLT